MYRKIQTLIALTSKQVSQFASLEHYRTKLKLTIYAEIAIIFLLLITNTTEVRYESYHINPVNLATSYSNKFDNFCQIQIFALKKISCHQKLTFILLKYIYYLSDCQRFLWFV